MQWNLDFAVYAIILYAIVLQETSSGEIQI